MAGLRTGGLPEITGSGMIIKEKRLFLMNSLFL
jgi:hypothetical protein